MDLDALRAAIASGDPSRAMPALAGLREASAEQAEPLLLLGLEQSAFMAQAVACNCKDKSTINSSPFNREKNK